MSTTIAAELGQSSRIVAGPHATPAGIALRVPRRRRQRTNVRVGLRELEGALTLLVAVSLLVLLGFLAGKRALRPYCPTVSVAVQPGDNLWKLASRYGDPDEYILERVARLRELNHLDANSTLHPGMVLQAPARPADLMEASEVRTLVSQR